MTEDPMVGAHWECCSTPPGAVVDPDELHGLVTQWHPTTVPGTAAGALRDAGLTYDGVNFDAFDWWFRARLPAPAGEGPWLLHLGGLATVADVWLNDEHILHSENMFVSHDIELPVLQRDNELVIRCASLAPLLAQRRSRPRWKTYLVSHQNLRWVRTTLLGRMPGWAATPAPVGPWRPVELRSAEPLRLVDRRVVASCDGEDGVVAFTLRLRGSLRSATVVVGDEQGELDCTPDGTDTVVKGSLRVPNVARWWPHTHGPQPLYGVTLRGDGVEMPLGNVGFRTLELDRTGGSFVLHVNGVPVFCRGATWMPVDAVSMSAPIDEVRGTLELLRDANMNMVRMPGTGVYQDSAFFDVCDELGILVWQDCMFAFVDLPDDPEFVAQVRAELGQVLSGMGGRPSIAVLCGGQENEEQPSMLALNRDKWVSSLLEFVLPALVGTALPGVPYVTNNPTGGGMPFQMDSGVSHFFGIGGYLGSVEEARRANVRFATECLAFATPPEPETIYEACGGITRAGHDPGWKLSVHHDAGRGWDLEDMQSYYMGQLFGVDPFMMRWQDPGRALELARATVATLMSAVMTEWRRPGSTCAGALVLALRDLRAGGGWGVIDALGRPKAPWYALRRMLAPVALLLTDEGLNGLRVHVVNDTAERVQVTVVVKLFAHGELCIEEGRRSVAVAGRQGLSLDVLELFEGFRDLTASYGFGPPAYDVVVAQLIGADGDVVSEAFYLPLGVARPVEGDLGLEARLAHTAEGHTLTVSARRFAQFVAIDVPGFRPTDSWFHVAPGGAHALRLVPTGGEKPAGHVRALNSLLTARIVAEEA